MVFLSEGSSDTEAPAVCIGKDLISQDHAISPEGAGIAHVAHGDLERSWLKMALHSRFCLLSIHCVSAHLQGPIDCKPTREQQALGLGKSWSERPLHREPQAGLLTGTELSLTGPSAGERRKNRTREINMRRAEPHRAVECGLYPADMKPRVTFLVVSRQSKAGHRRPGREGKFTSTDKHDLSSESKHYIGWVGASSWGGGPGWGGGPIVQVLHDAYGDINL